MSRFIIIGNNAWQRIGGNKICLSDNGEDDSNDIGDENPDNLNKCIIANMCSCGEDINILKEAIENFTINGVDKLNTARKLKVDLGSTTDITFDGSGDTLSIPISGVLPIANGGTGRNDGKAVALATARTINGVAFDGSANITILNASVVYDTTLPLSALAHNTMGTLFLVTGKTSGWGAGCGALIIVWRQNNSLGITQLAGNGSFTYENEALTYSNPCSWRFIRFIPLVQVP
jgi:hypothetical protein